MGRRANRRWVETEIISRTASGAPLVPGSGGGYLRDDGRLTGGRLPPVTPVPRMALPAGRVSGNAHHAHHRLLDVSLPVQSSSSPEVATVSHSRIGNWLCPWRCWHLLSSTGLCRPDPPVWECSETISSPPLAGSTAASVRYPKAAQGCYIRLGDSSPIAPARNTSIVRSTASAFGMDSRS